MAAHHRHPQPPQALAAHDGPDARLSTRPARPALAPAAPKSHRDDAPPQPPTFTRQPHVPASVSVAAHDMLTMDEVRGSRPLDAPLSLARRVRGSIRAASVRRHMAAVGGGAAH